MQKEHYSIANLEFCYSFILQHVLELVSQQRPDSIGIFLAMLGNDLLVNLIELNEIRPSQGKVTEQFLSLEFPRHELQVLRVLLIEDDSRLALSSLGLGFLRIVLCYSTYIHFLQELKILFSLSI